jgi:hypothetical protein
MELTVVSRSPAWASRAAKSCSEHSLPPSFTIFEMDEPMRVTDGSHGSGSVLQYVRTNALYKEAQGLLAFARTLNEGVARAPLGGQDERH